MKLKYVCHWVLGALVLITAASVRSYAATAYGPPVTVPESDPTLLIGIGIASIGYLAGIARYRNKK